MGEANEQNTPRRDPPSKGEIYAIQIGLVFTSVLMGGMFGIAAVAGMDGFTYAEEGFIPGAFVGFIFSPFLLFGLWKKQIWQGLLTVFIPTLGASYFTGLSAYGSEFVFLLPIVFYMVLPIGVKIGFPDTWRYPLHCCQRCGYDLTGLTDSLKCPECGAATPQAAEPDNPDHSTD